MRSRALVRGIAALTVAALVATGCKKAETARGRQAVTFRTEDGFLLEGTVFGSGPQAVVLAHMFPADQSSWFEFARDLAGDGYQVLTFNFRGYGNSEGSKEISLIDRDVRSAVRFMSDGRGVTGVALGGASMGGTAALIAAASVPVRAVVMLSAPVEFMGLDASGMAGRVVVPKLFVAAKDDPGAADAAERLHSDSPPPREIHILPGSRHGTDIFKGDHSREVADLIKDFLAKAFGT